MLSKEMSLILPTLNRKAELNNFLLSIENQDIDIELIEVIIVDQNEPGTLDELLNRFSNIDIVYIHSSVKGLSYNRNIGLAHAKGKIVSFPDDDCLYNVETVSTVLKKFGTTNSNFVVGQIFDLDNLNKIIKHWPSRELLLSKFNFYFLSSSITLFIKNDNLLKFDVNLGAGARYGSCEDPDFIYRLLCRGSIGIYSPLIRVRHPSPDFENISREKVVSYASGFGYLVAKHRDVYIFSLLLLLILHKMSQKVRSLFGRDCYYDGYFVDFFRGLIIGLRSCVK